MIDAVRAVVQVENFMAATSQLAQTTLRSVLGKHDLDEMLQERDKLNKDIQDILDQQTEAWGIKVSNVEIKHVDVDPSMIRAIAKQAEAERERRAKVILAEGEEQAAAKLAEAAHILATQPGSMDLRYLNSLQEIAGDRHQHHCLSVRPQRRCAGRAARRLNAVWPVKPDGAQRIGSDGLTERVQMV